MTQFTDYAKEIIMREARKHYEEATAIMYKMSDAEGSECIKNYFNNMLWKYNDVIDRAINYAAISYALNQLKSILKTDVLPASNNVILDLSAEVNGLANRWFLSENDEEQDALEKIINFKKENEISFIN